MKVGTLAYATDQGLGILARSFYDHGIVNEILRVKHGRWPNHPEWYPGSREINARPFQFSEARKFCRSMDIMMFFETPFNWELIGYCRENGVKTVLMPMYECMPSKLPAQPDLIICPSTLDQMYYPEGVYLPVPVDVPWKQRDRARVFVHNAGHGGLNGRNGTAELVEAIHHIENPIKLIIRAQNELQWENHWNSVKVEIRVGNVPYEQLFTEGDVFVFPEKFNGLSLPLQEAHASGMLVMGTNRFPMNQWLPNEPLIPVSDIRENRIAGYTNMFDEACVRPEDIARVIDEWYDKDITEYSLMGWEYAEQNSWAKLAPLYIEQLEKLCSV